jgi:hypothetical protein
VASRLFGEGDGHNDDLVVAAIALAEDATILAYSRDKLPRLSAWSTL